MSRSTSCGGDMFTMSVTAANAPGCKLLQTLGDPQAIKSVKQAQQVASCRASMAQNVKRSVKHLQQTGLEPLVTRQSSSA